MKAFSIKSYCLPIVLVAAMFPLSNSWAAPTKSLCKTCVEADAMATEITNGKVSAVDRAVNWLEAFQFSKDKAIRAKEVSSILNLAAQLIPKDNEGVSDQYFYSIYESNKAEMSKALEKLPKQQKELLQHSLKNTENVWQHGNG